MNLRLEKHPILVHVVNAERDVVQLQHWVIPSTEDEIRDQVWRYVASRITKPERVPKISRFDVGN